MMHSVTRPMMGSMTNTRHFTVLALGSAGDVHPLLAIAIELQERGHDVLFLSTPEMEKLAQAANLPFGAICTQADLDKTLCHPKLWDARASLGVLWRYLGVPAIRPSFNSLVARLKAHPQASHTVIASALAMGARIARECHAFHLVNAYTSPANLRQIDGPFFIGDVPIPSWLNRMSKHALWSVLDHYKLDPLMRPGIEGFRSELGMHPIGKGYLKTWMHSPDAGIALWPKWWDAIQHPRQYQAPWQADFVFLDPAPSAKLPAALQDFLNAGKPPIVWMPGSAVRNTRDFFHNAQKLCTELKERGLFLSSQMEQFPITIPGQTYAASLTPFAALLPHCKLLVHHGGIGSTAAAIRAGIPQVIVASAFDQFFNGQRVAQLGVGTWIKSTHATLAQLAKKIRLALLISSTSIAFFQKQIDAKRTRIEISNGLEELSTTSVKISARLNQSR